MQHRCHLEILIKKDMENHAHFKLLTGSENISKTDESKSDFS